MKTSNKDCDLKIMSLNEDFSEYCHLYEMSTNRSVYLLPSYLKSIQLAEGYPVIIMVLFDDEKMAMIPYIKRRINDIPIFAELDYEYWDIISPYEYSYAITNVDDPDERDYLINQLFLQIGYYCERENIVSEFIRFDPFLSDINCISSLYKVRNSCNNIFINLIDSINDIRKKFNNSVKKNIKRAQDCGLRFSQARENDENINLFISLYRESMKRLGADDYYYFSEEHFYSLIKECEGASLFFIRDDSARLIAGSILLHHEGIGHHHLTGYKEDSILKRPNDYMVYSLINWGIANGLQYLHLGGGSENICNFKAKFSDTKLPYYIGWRIHNQNVYQLLCDLWREVNDISNEHEFNYFPLYRLRY